MYPNLIHTYFDSRCHQLPVAYHPSTPANHPTEALNPIKVVGVVDVPVMDGYLFSPDSKPINQIQNNALAPVRLCPPYNYDGASNVNN